ncbi:MAG: hypothetical protein ACLR8A_06240 [Bacteroides caccae]
MATTDYILNVGGANKSGYDGKAFKVPSATAKVLAVVNPSDKVQNGLCGFRFLVCHQRCCGADT